MAIKGKRRSKTKRVAGAPRREVVYVAPRWFARTWVRALAAFVLGIAVSIFAIWLTNGLRESAAENERSDDSASARTAVQAWTDRLSQEAAGVATIAQGAPPLLLPEVAAAIDDISAGRDVDPAVLAEGRSALKVAIEGLSGFELTDAIRNQGLDVAETNYVLNSRDKIVEALRVYREGVDLARQAAGASGEEREALAAIAVGLRDRATSQFADGYDDLVQAQASVGIVQQPSVPGLSGALGLP
jgi:hypothetical protein